MRTGARLSLVHRTAAAKPQEALHCSVPAVARAGKSLHHSNAVAKSRLAHHVVHTSRHLSSLCRRSSSCCSSPMRGGLLLLLWLPLGYGL